MTTATTLSPIDVQVMWNRLVAIVEEQAQTLIHIAFSTAVREAGDLSAGVFDTDGKMIAQAVTGTPGHVNSMAMSVGHFLLRHPVETMQPGDVFLTNDPWLATGHLFDFTVVSPAFRHGRLVALFACTAHVVDVGGIGFGADGRQVFEEGICIPIMPLARAGVLNQAVFDILEANVREPLQVRGDLHSLAACNEMGCRRLVEMMDEFALDDLAELAAIILANSHAAMLAEIARLPPGDYRHSMVVDGFERPITLHASMRVRHDGIHVDYSGTSPCSARGINVPLAYTTAYTAFGIRCMVGAGILNNAGSLAPITVHAPEGCILNAPRPHAVSARQVVGQMLPDLLFGCLHQVVAGGAPAEGAASLWSVPLFGGPGIGADADDATPGTRFTVMGIVAGGTGARPRQDGLSATAFPSRVRGIPIEILETLAPVVFWTKELRPDSGGAGEFRGGLGQTLEIGCLEDASFAMSPGTCDRILHPARGREGGQPGACGWIGLASGRRFEDKFRHMIPPGERLVMKLPGGGGFGPPEQRAPEAMARDVAYGFVSPEAALRDYGSVAENPAGANNKETSS
ncbi:MAG: hydantoinase B/oxoprolinase family protein [Acetobacteraceae bacterium]|jgi:N-methylhydantoinase B